MLLCTLIFEDIGKLHSLYFSSRVRVKHFLSLSFNDSTNIDSDLLLIVPVTVNKCAEHIDTHVIGWSEVFFLIYKLKLKAAD